jgi:hypothetical protein
MPPTAAGPAHAERKGEHRGAGALRWRRRQVQHLPPHAVVVAAADLQTLTAKARETSQAALELISDRFGCWAITLVSSYGRYIPDDRFADHRKRNPRFTSSYLIAKTNTGSPW